MKKCPFCAEEIQEEALKCRFCGEYLDGEEGRSASLSPTRLKWYHRTGTLVMIFLCAGPVVLPFLWTRPKLNTPYKILWTCVVIFLTWMLSTLMLKSFHAIMDYYGLIFDQLPAY